MDDAPTIRDVLRRDLPKDLYRKFQLAFGNRVSQLYRFSEWLRAKQITYVAEQGLTLSSNRTCGRSAVHPIQR